jgi:hypothetical protein
VSTTTATQTTTVGTGPIGSSWDACNGPEGTLAHHLREWVKDSACHPALAAANLLSLQGADVLQALAGDRLETLGGWASQYTTGKVSSLLRSLEPVSEGGGWWCSGLDPLADWAPMGWGCFKPERPRWDSEKGKFRRYEHPIGPKSRTFWLRVPAAVAAIVADRFKKAMPPEVAADRTGDRGAFWRWWAQTPALPLLLTEGAKKAGALLSIGVPAVALPGIWPGQTARAELLAQSLKGRSVWVLFDASTREDPDEPKAADRLGQELARVGAKVKVGIVPGTHGKGADDHLVNGGSWEDLAACLHPVKPAPALHRLRQCDAVAPAGAHLSETITLPSDKRLVVIRAPMGSGKTDWIAKAVARYQHEGRRVVLITHRTSLGAACAEKIGLPWAEEAAPGSDLRQTGIALCVDSLHPRSALRFRASEWRDAVVIIDEAAQVLHHTLMGRGTAVADHRAEILVQLFELLAHAHLVLAADAQLGNPHLEALESAVGERAWLIGSAHRPAAGRSLTVHPSRDSWRLDLKKAIQRQEHIWISTTAKDHGSQNGASNLAKLVTAHWPEARILVVDSDTVDDPTHDASRLASDPNGISTAYDVVITTPAIQSGVSVDKTPFDVVFSIAGGNTAPEGVVQSVARVRCDCPRHIYAPSCSPGDRLKIGSGSTDPKQILQSHGHHITVVVGQLARAGVNLETSSSGPWLPLWAKLAAHQNRQSMAFATTVVALLEEEGYAVTHLAEIAPEQQDDALQIRQELKDIANAAQAVADEAVRKVEVISDYDAQELLKKRRRTPSQKTALARWKIDRAWGLRGAAPSPDLLNQDRDGAWKSHRFRWLITEPSTQPLVAAHDRAIAAKIKWAPDLAHQTLGTKVATALALGLRDWLQRAGGDWFTAENPELVRLQTTALALKHDLRQVLGISPAQTGIATLRRLLRLVGARLESHRNFGNFVDGKRQTHYAYRVVIDAPPDGVDASALPEVFASSLKEVCTKKSPT